MNLKKQSAVGRDPAVTLEESDRISCRGEAMLLSSVRELSEAKPSCSLHCFAFKQRLSPLDIPRFRNGTAEPLPATDCVSIMFFSASGRCYEKMFLNEMAVAYIIFLVFMIE